MKFKTYLVGGAVRDGLLGLKPKDLDFVVLSPSFRAMRESLLADGVDIFVEKPEYVTIRCRHPKFGVADFSCARCDGEYKDGRHPEKVTLTDDLTQDLARRDFTICAIARDMETNELVDPFNGVSDIAAKLVRCVRNPLDRFTEDKLRLFRAIRFAVQKGFRIENETYDAIRVFSINDCNGVSTERILDEVTKMFIVDTFNTVHYLFTEFPRLGLIMNERGIWFKPTLEHRPIKQVQNYVEVMG